LCEDIKTLKVGYAYKGHLTRVHHTVSKKKVFIIRLVHNETSKRS